MTSAQAEARVEDRCDHLKVTLSNFGRRNALAPSMYVSLRAALEQAAAEDRLGAVVLTGADGYFCAGGDLNALATRAAMSRDERRALIEDLHATIRAIRACPRLVIAAIEGGAAGAGLSVALACDLRVAEEHAQMALPEAGVGLLPCAGGTQWLAWTVGESWAKRLVLLGEERLPDGPCVDLAAAERGRAVGRCEEDERHVVDAEPGPVQGVQHQTVGRTPLGHSYLASTQLCDRLDRRALGHDDLAVAAVEFVEDAAVRLLLLHGQLGVGVK